MKQKIPPEVRMLAVNRIWTTAFRSLGAAMAAGVPFPRTAPEGWAKTVDAEIRKDQELQSRWSEHIAEVDPPTESKLWVGRMSKHGRLARKFLSTDLQLSKLWVDRHKQALATLRTMHADQIHSARGKRKPKRFLSILPINAPANLRHGPNEIIEQRHRGVWRPVKPGTSVQVLPRATPDNAQRYYVKPLQMRNNAKVPSGSSVDGTCHVFGPALIERSKVGRESWVYGLCSVVNSVVVSNAVVSDRAVVESSNVRLGAVVREQAKVRSSSISGSRAVVQGCAVVERCTVLGVVEGTAVLTGCLVEAGAYVGTGEHRDKRFRLDRDSKRTLIVPK